jgi:hypothetical protein
MVKMSKVKYLFIDDEKDLSTEAITDGFNDTGIITVIYHRAENFKDQLIYFDKELIKYDGLIIDLRLDGNLSQNLRYTAVSLAQEIRTKAATKKGYIDVPIILCSTDQKIKALYEKDQTSHDLFDYHILKEASPNWREHSLKLKTIAAGYKTIKRLGFNLEKIFGRDISKLDQRILGKFLDKNIFPVHALAGHIIKEIIEQPGPLINDLYLASRLGIDIKKSTDWEKLINQHFNDAKYTGVFSTGWDRWWADCVIEIFNRLTGQRLSTLKAIDRVTLLKEKTKLNKLTAATPIDNSVSTNFWTICEYYKKPLDPMEGFKVFSYKELRPWQDERYLSFEAAAERKGKIHPTEKARLEFAKKTHKKTK